MEWVRALHVIAIIAWMAGMLYLPRLFVYHADTEPGSDTSETFKIMERRLYRAITTPAMIAAWVFGLWMAGHFGYFTGGDLWFWAKLVLVLALSGMHGLFGRHLKAFAADRREKPARYYRMVNEVPTLLMVGIVILVVVRPF